MKNLQQRKPLDLKVCPLYTSDLVEFEYKGTPHIGMITRIVGQFYIIEDRHGTEYTVEAIHIFKHVRKQKLTGLAKAFHDDPSLATKTLDLLTVLRSFEPDDVERKAMDVLFRSIIFGAKQ